MKKKGNMRCYCNFAFLYEEIFARSKARGTVAAIVAIGKHQLKTHKSAFI